jgi:hypothetical protein
LASSKPANKTVRIINWIINEKRPAPAGLFFFEAESKLSIGLILRGRLPGLPVPLTLSLLRADEDVCRSTNVREIKNPPQSFRQVLALASLLNAGRTSPSHERET